MIDVRVRAAIISEARIGGAILLHVLVNEFLQVDAEGAIDADNFVGADAGVGGDVSIGIGDVDVGGFVANGVGGAFVGGGEEAGEELGIGRLDGDRMGRGNVETWQKETKRLQRRIFQQDAFMRVPIVHSSVT